MSVTESSVKAALGIKKRKPKTEPEPPKCICTKKRIGNLVSASPDCKLHGLFDRFDAAWEQKRSTHSLAIQAGI